MEVIRGIITTSILKGSHNHKFAEKAIGFDV